jgi:hypothetical protein
MMMITEATVSLIIGILVRARAVAGISTSASGDHIRPGAAFCLRWLPLQPGTGYRWWPALG